MDGNMPDLSGMLRWEKGSQDCWEGWHQSSIQLASFLSSLSSGFAKQCLAPGGNCSVNVSRGHSYISLKDISSRLWSPLENCPCPPPTAMF